MVELRREAEHIFRHYRRHHRVGAGENLVWFEFVALGPDAETDSTYDPVYDEGGAGPGGLRYRPGVLLPCLMVTESEDQERAIPEGRQPLQIVNALMSMQDVLAAAIHQPWEYQRHLNDLFLYDGRYFEVNTYRVRGRIRTDMLLVVEGVETYVAQEMPFSPGPAAMGVDDFPWPNRLP